MYVYSAEDVFVPFQFPNIIMCFLHTSMYEYGWDTTIRFVYNVGTATGLQVLKKANPVIKCEASWRFLNAFFSF